MGKFFDRFYKFALVASVIALLVISLSDTRRKPEKKVIKDYECETGLEVKKYVSATEGDSEEGLDNLFVIGPYNEDELDEKVADPCGDKVRYSNGYYDVYNFVKKYGSINGAGPINRSSEDNALGLYTFTDPQGNCYFYIHQNNNKQK